MLPALPQAITLLQQSHLLSFAARPSAADLPFALIPVFLVPALLLLGAAEWAGGRSPRWVAPLAGGPVLALATLLLLLPVFVYFTLSQLTGVRLFLGRYLLPTAPGLVILWGWFQRGIEPASLRRTSLLTTVLLSVLWLGGSSAMPAYAGENWRSAVHSMPNAGAILLYSGLVETRRLNWLQSPEHWSYLGAPVTVYRPSVSPQDVFIVPFDIGSPEKAYMDHLLAGSLRERKTITLIARHSFSGPQWTSWLSRRLMDIGYPEVLSSAFGLVDVHVFQSDHLPSTENASSTFPGAPPKLP